MWGDVLLNVGSGDFVYDEIGNPTTYKNGKTYSLSWTEGRRLASGSTKSLSFTYCYNIDGLRTRKTVGYQDYYYYWQDGRLVGMTCPGGSFRFYYDESGRPYAVKVHDDVANTDTSFLYVTNLQGDPGA